MKREDAQAIALRILLIYIENGSASLHNAQRHLQEWTRFLQENVDDEINWELLSRMK